MSWPERSVQYHRQQTDRAVHRACSQLAAYPSVLEKFLETLHCVRQRAPRLFEAPVTNGRHSGVDALMHLSRFHEWRAQPLTGWEATSASWRPVVSSLAHHLFYRYRVPAFLSSVWHATDAAADKKRVWVMEHSCGKSFRLLDLPVSLTRKMEHIFLASPDHLPLEHAIRRSELLALGMPVPFVKAVLATRLVSDLRHGEFWRTVWLFLVANASEMDATQVGPMIDYLNAIRHDRVTVETADGPTVAEPPQPNFSIKGRTVKSLLRQMQDWHRSLERAGPVFSWPQSTFNRFTLTSQAMRNPINREGAGKWSN